MINQTQIRIFNCFSFFFVLNLFITDAGTISCLERCHSALDYVNQTRIELVLEQPPVYLPLLSSIDSPSAEHSHTKENGSVLFCDPFIIFSLYYFNSIAEKVLKTNTILLNHQNISLIQKSFIIDQFSGGKPPLFS